MNVIDFINELKRSENKLLGGVVRDIADWSKLTRDKKSLELFLTYNIAVVRTKSHGDVLVSSNPIYIKYLNGQRLTRKKSGVVRIIGRTPQYDRLLRSSNKQIVRTWNLVENDKFEIRLDENWSINRWIALDKSNIEVLATATNEILQRDKKAT